MSKNKIQTSFEILQKFDENKFKNLSKDIKNSLSNFLQKEMIYQEDFFKEKDKNDKVFNELKEKIKIELITISMKSKPLIYS